MAVRRVVASLAAVMAAALPPHSACAAQAPPGADSSVIDLPVGNGALHVRVIGRGQPAIVLHGGPDFDYGYLLPELDRFADELRLIYYDQRGRGQSARGVQPDHVTIGSEVSDVDRVRQHFGLASAVVLGHSWGAVLAAEYALRYPGRVSRLILMNPAPLSSRDLAVLRKAQVEKLGPDMDRQRAIIAGAAYKAGDPDTVAARYRIHFKYALARPEDYESLMARMKAAFVRQGSQGILEARAVEDRLMLDTWGRPDYDLLPRLRELRIPTLVVTGDRDFIPVEIAERIARAFPNATFVNIPDCGHFSYLECGAEVRKAVDAFMKPGAAPAKRE
jgi:proline iminopeptidase